MCKHGFSILVTEWLIISAQLFRVLGVPVSFLVSSCCSIPPTSSGVLRAHKKKTDQLTLPHEAPTLVAHWRGSQTFKSANLIMTSLCSICRGAHDVITRASRQGKAKNRQKGFHGHQIYGQNRALLPERLPYGEGWGLWCTGMNHG